MTLEHVLKLIKSLNPDDHILALNLLVHNFSKVEIIDFFGKYGDLFHTDSSVLSDNHFSICRSQESYWEYYWYKDIGFYMSEQKLQLYRHPNRYSSTWNPKEL